MHTAIRSKLFSAQSWLLIAAALSATQLIANVFYLGTWFDEGNYVLHANIAIRGVYPMYASGGPAYLYMPLAYLIPGLVQLLFGPSFWAARAFSVGCALALVAVLATLNRMLSGSKAAALAVSFLAGSIVALRFYAAAVPLSVVALAVTLCFLSLASRLASPWRECLAVIFAALACGFRQNMIIFWAMVSVYALLEQRQWLHRALVTAVGLLSVAVLFIPFWPGILERILIPVVGELIVQVLGLPVLINVGPPGRWTLEGALMGVYSMVAANLAVMASAFLGGIWVVLQSWLARKTWWNDRHNRLIALLAVTFWVNVVLHIIGAQEYCVFCPYSYIHNFIPLGITLGTWWVTRVMDDETVRRWFGLPGHWLVVLIALTFVAGILMFLLGAEQRCTTCPFVYVQYFVPLMLAVGLGLSVMWVNRHMVSRSPHSAMPAHLSLRMAARIARAFLLLALGTGTVIFLTLLPHISQNPAVLGRYSFGYSGFLLALGLVILGGVWLLGVSETQIAALVIRLYRTRGRIWLALLACTAIVPASLAAIEAAAHWEPGRTLSFRTSVLALAALVCAYLIFLYLGRARFVYKTTVFAWVVAGSTVAGAGGMLAYIGTPVDLPWRPGIEKQFASAETSGLRLQALIGPTDKIFSILDAHPLVYAERYPFPPLMLNAHTLVVSRDSQNALYFNRWNYDLAERWLDEADVVLTSDARVSRFESFYAGYPGSGADILALIETRLGRDFYWVEDIPSSTEGVIHVYRRQ